MTSTPLAYSIAEACKLTSVGRTTLYAAIKAGGLKTHKIGRRKLIGADDLACWLDSNQVVRPSTSEEPNRAIVTNAVRS